MFIVLTEQNTFTTIIVVVPKNGVKLSSRIIPTQKLHQKFIQFAQRLIIEKFFIVSVVAVSVFICSKFSVVCCDDGKKPNHQPN